MSFFGSPYVYDLNQPLVRLSGRDTLRAGQLMEGVLVTGASGSGKTSGSGHLMASAVLSAGWGGIVLCAKPDEADLWRQRCKQAGRLSCTVVFDGSGKHRYNFMQHEIERAPGGGQLIMNLVALLTTVINAASGRLGMQGSGENAFWEKSMKEALMHALGVLWCAYGRLNLFDLFSLLQSRPAHPGQAADPAWHQSSFMAATLMKAETAPAHPMSPLDYRAAFKFLTVTLANPDARTTGNLLATISADLAPLMQGKMRELFCTGTTILPEMTHEGAIIILDFPLKVYAEAGLLAQHIFKYMWQRSVERREVKRRTRPVFCFADEYQFFCSPYDMEFQATARSARASSIYLTQNLPGLYARIGGNKPEHAADALLGNFATKIFHANSCHRTNQWAADMIGKGVRLRWSGNASNGINIGRSANQGGGYSSNGNSPGSSSSNWGTSTSAGLSMNEGAGFSEQIDYLIQPGEFTRLAKGGREYRRRVEGVVFQNGRVFEHSGRTFLPVIFRQD